METGIPSSSHETLSERLRSLFLETKNVFFRFMERDFTLRDIALLFFLGFFVGIAFKVSLHNVLTIGFEDYRLADSRTLVDFNQVQSDILAKGGSLAVSPNPPTAPLCTDKSPSAQ